MGLGLPLLLLLPATAVSDAGTVEDEAVIDMPSEVFVLSEEETLESVITDEDEVDVVAFGRCEKRCKSNWPRWYCCCCA